MDYYFKQESMIINPEANIELKGEYRKPIVRQGASLGANSTIICDVEIGKYAFVGAGAALTKDVKPLIVVVGIPARHCGWASHAGEPLGTNLKCPREGRQYFIDKQGKSKRETFNS
jgi:UDP-2-acetamido-3-amino-2,3-dideoxy-glucuronate N-acetyltransferase